MEHTLTPSPWKVTVRHGSGGRASVKGSGGQIVATRPGGLSAPDAALIAAAPDLLAALKILIADAEADGNNGTDWDIARAAIAKAESK